MTGAGHMEPMLPDIDVAMSDTIVELVAQAQALSGSLHPILRSTVGDLVRSMNCYYSNLIEGHDTQLIDIERALNNDYSAAPEKRDLQLEARAHIEVKWLIDHGQMPYPAYSAEGVCWIDEAFCERLPASLLEVPLPGGEAMMTMVPGALWQAHVMVGRHEAPEPEALPELLARFTEAYTPMAMAASPASCPMPGSAKSGLDRNSGRCPGASPATSSDTRLCCRRRTNPGAGHWMAAGRALDVCCLWARADRLGVTHHLQRDAADFIHLGIRVFALKLSPNLKPVNACIIQLAAEFAGIDGEPKVEGLGDVGRLALGNQQKPIAHLSLLFVRVTPPGLAVLVGGLVSLDIALSGPEAGAEREKPGKPGFLFSEIPR
jgi:hypothetical protein